MSDRPLSGIRIVDFCWVGAGSYATKLLADQGADVIKIESRARVDGIRLSGPFAGGKPGVNRSGYFADRNTSKRSCTINMKTPEGQRLARELVARSDVVANSFTPGVMDRFGLGWEDVQLLNPRAVYLAMSMQGDGGPERDYLGYGLTISALVGLHGLSGLPDRLPVGTGTNYPDHIPNPCHAAFAVLAALRHVRRTGEGQYIDLAQTEATISTLGPALLEYTVNGRDRERQGNRHDRHSPHGVYPCRGDDRWVAIAATSDDEYRSVLSVLGIDPARLSPSLSASERLASADRIDLVLADATAHREQMELALELQRAGVPAAPVHDAAGVVDGDAQLAARGHWVRLDHPEMGETLYNAPPFRFSVTSEPLTVPAPMLGQHTVEICRDILGLSDAEIARLQEAEVLA
ncbi:MAG TPA: CoA transferase [Acidimicrobiia bacterium]|nr:CoA transferase [Acidimicrobiia bacterium]